MCYELFINAKLKKYLKVNEQMVVFLIMKKEMLVTCVLHDKSILFGVLQTIQIDRILCLCKSV